MLVQKAVAILELIISDIQLGLGNILPSMFA